MDGWNTSFLLETTMFRVYVSFREGICFVCFVFCCIISVLKDILGARWFKWFGLRSIEHLEQCHGEPSFRQSLTVQHIEISFHLPSHISPLISLDSASHCHSSCSVGPHGWQRRQGGISKCQWYSVIDGFLKISYMPFQTSPNFRILFVFIFGDHTCEPCFFKATFDS